LKFVNKMKTEVNKNYPYKVVNERYSEIYYEILNTISNEHLDKLQEAVLMREMALFGRSMGKVRIEVKTLIKTVESHYDKSFEQLRAKCRNREFLEPRQVLMWLLRNIRKDITSGAVGELFDRDHATVLHADKTISDIIKFDQEFRENKIFPILNSLGYRVSWDSEERSLSFYKPTEGEYEELIQDESSQNKEDETIPD
jgi:hypothetical protein